jgi:drug/metabolite transporter (DMT)-like permease
MTTAKTDVKWNVGKIIGGIICLACGVLLTVLIFVLPEDQVVFMVGDLNAPGIPAVVLAIIGIVLLATAKESQADLEEKILVVDSEKAAQNKRLETMGWGLFLIMLGGFAFVPHETVPKGLWSVGVGLIMLGLNGARYYYGIKMSGFTTFLGILALLSGITELLGMHSVDGAILLIILGAYLVLKPWFDKNRIFGKAEEG